MAEQKSVYNFHPGPATLPKEVMRQAQEEFVNYPGLGYGIMEESHRGPLYMKVNDQAEANVRELLKVSADYDVIFLQGGASLQFAMVPMNMGVPGKPMVYADTGAWPSKAIKEAKLLGDVQVGFDGKPYNYSRIGDPTEWQVPANAAYFYICTNNTIEGTQYRFFPETGDVPLIADMSSDIMSRPLDVSKFGLIFAGAQKNLGPAGVTLVIVRKDLLTRESPKVPAILRYSTHAAEKSLYNTPPSFAVYMLMLVTDWLKKQGGLEAIERINTAKSQALYEAIDGSKYYHGTAEAGDRSNMNVTFRLPSEDLEKKFVKEAEAIGLIGLKGHRAVGGVRASLYNAMPLAGVERLVDFMAEFEAKNG